MAKLNGNYLEVLHIPTGKVGIVVAASLRGTVKTYWFQEESGRSGFVDERSNFEPIGRRIVRDFVLNHPS